MDDPTHHDDERRRWTRRDFLVTAGTTVGAVAAGSVASLATGRPPVWSEEHAVFEQSVDLWVPSDLEGPVTVTLELHDHGATRHIARVAATPDHTIPLTLTYPFESLVPGDYAYTATVRDRRGVERRSAPIVIPLARVRFGC